MNKKVRSYLIEKCRDRVDPTVTYQKLSDACQLDLNMHDSISDREKIAEILDNISVFEYENDRPLLSSIVIRLKDNEEGNGFYKMAQRLGYGNWQTLKKSTFAMEEIQKCVEYWKENGNHSDFK